MDDLYYTADLFKADSFPAEERYHDSGYDKLATDCIQTLDVEDIASTLLVKIMKNSALERELFLAIKSHDYSAFEAAYDKYDQFFSNSNDFYHVKKGAKRIEVFLKFIETHKEANIIQTAVEFYVKSKLISPENLLMSLWVKEHTETVETLFSQHCFLTKKHYHNFCQAFDFSKSLDTEIQEQFFKMQSFFELDKSLKQFQSKKKGKKGKI